MSPVFFTGVPLKTVPLRTPTQQHSPHPQPTPSNRRRLHGLLVLERQVAVNREESADVVKRQAAKTANVSLAHRSVRKKALTLLDVKEAVLDRVADKKALHLHRVGLPNAVGAIDGLVLRSRVPLFVSITSYRVRPKTTVLTARSHMITFDAIVRFRPTPPALVEMSITGIESAMPGGVEKRRIASSRLP